MCNRTMSTMEHQLTGHVLSSKRLLLQPVTIAPEHEHTMATEKPFLVYTE
jgi:hypothetical protein